MTVQKIENLPGFNVMRCFYILSSAKLKDIKLTLDIVGGWMGRITDLCNMPSKLLVVGSVRFL